MEIMKLHHIRAIHLYLKSATHILTDEDFGNLLGRCSYLLKSLDLSVTKFTGESLSGSNIQLKKLETLQLSWNKLQDHGLGALLSVCGPKLYLLDLSWTNISGDGLTGYNIHVKSLKILDLSYCSQLTDTGLFELLRLCGSKLKSLLLAGTNISDDLLADWIEQQPLLQLRTLDLQECDLGSEGVARISAVLTLCQIHSSGFDDADDLEISSDDSHDYFSYESQD